MQKIFCTSVISSERGEHLFKHIVFDENSFNVGEEVFRVDLLGGREEEIVTTRKGDRKGLQSFDMDDKDTQIKVLPKTLQVQDSTEPVVALVFVQGPKRKHVDWKNRDRLKTNIRCPMPINYWKEIGIIERSRDNVKTKKEEFKSGFTFSVDLSNSGAKIIMPQKINSNSYLVALAPGGSFEWVLSRKSKYPNCYRIEADNSGQIRLIDPRQEARK